MYRRQFLGENRLLVSRVDKDLRERTSKFSSFSGTSLVKFDFAVRGKRQEQLPDRLGWSESDA